VDAESQGRPIAALLVCRINEDRHPGEASQLQLARRYRGAERPQSGCVDIVLNKETLPHSCNRDSGLRHRGPAEAGPSREERDREDVVAVGDALYRPFDQTLVCYALRTVID